MKLISLSAKGMQTILHILKPDDVFGELLLAQQTRPFTAIAIEDIVATVISREGFLVLFSSVPAVALNFVRLLSKRLMKVERELAEFGHSWSYHRLATVLLKLCEDHGKETPTGIRIELRLTHEDLANLIGTKGERGRIPAAAHFGDGQQGFRPQASARVRIRSTRRRQSRRALTHGDQPLIFDGYQIRIRNLRSDA